MSSAPATSPVGIPADSVVDTPMDSPADTMSPEILAVPLGRQVLVVADLLLAPLATPTSSALATDLATTLEQWQGAGTVVACGNFFGRMGPDAVLDGTAVAGVLAAHADLTQAIRDFCAQDGARFLVQAGWRDPEVATDPAVVTELAAAGIEIAGPIELHLTTASGDRKILVQPAHPGSGISSEVDDESIDDRPWLAGIDRLEDPDGIPQFIRSRTFYRQLGHFVWVPPVVAVIVALIVRSTVVFHGASRLVRHAAGPRRFLQRAYHATWTDRFFFTLAAIAVVELIVGVAVAVVSRRVWRSRGGGPIPAPWSLATGADLPQSDELVIDGESTLDVARAAIADGTTGLVSGGRLRPELTHLGSGFFACPGGTTEVVRMHAGRLGLPPVFLHHRQASWVEIESGADVHVRLLVADVDLPSSTALERHATSYKVVKGYKGAADLHPALAASWPHGTSWPPAPDVAADRVRTRRVRRTVAGAIFVAGLVDLLLSVNRPQTSHLHLIHQYLPLGFVQATGALVALSGIGLMMLARGIARGQRRAWTVATLTLLGSLVLHALHGASVGGILVTGLVLALLFAERELFAAAADRASMRSAFITLFVGAAVSVTAAFIAIEITGRIHRHSVPSWPHVLLAAVERLVGLSTVALPDTVNDWVSPSMLAVGFALAVVTLFLLTRPVVDRRLSSRHLDGDTGATVRRTTEIRARDIVRRHGTGTLDYFALRDDKEWFFHRDGLVAYAVSAGVCLVSPDPICPPTERRHVWDAFRRHCDQRGWAVAVMAAAEEWLPVYRDSGMRHVYLGDEAVVDVQEFSLAGGKMKGLRQAVARIERYGYTVEHHDPTTLSPRVRVELTDLISRHRRGGHERGFSMMLGRVFDPRDAGLLVTVVRGLEGEAVAVCQFVPSAAIQGYSLDLMRRDPGEHPNGLLDFALCSTIEYMRQHGQRGLSLNFAAMRSTLEGESGDSITQRVERWILRWMSGFLQIESLWRFNAKYEPTWLPRYVAFDSAEQFAPTLVTILRAESISEVPVVGRLFTPSSARKQALVTDPTSETETAAGAEAGTGTGAKTGTSGN